MTQTVLQLFDTIRVVDPNRHIRNNVLLISVAGIQYELYFAGSSWYELKMYQQVKAVLIFDYRHFYYPWISLSFYTIIADHNPELQVNPQISADHDRSRDTR